MILVAGGTGRLGSLVVAGLAVRGHQVRVLTRDPARAAHLLRPSVEVVIADVRDPASLVPAFAGIDAVVSAIHGFAGPGGVSPQSVDRDGNAHLVAAAKVVGADMVMVSVVGAATDHALELFRMKAAAEENLLASGIAWTIVRSTGFLDLYLDLMRRSAGKSGRPMVFGRGQNPINFASVSEVADVVVDAALDPALRGRAIDVRGQDLTLDQVAGMVQRELGTSDRRLRHVPRAILRIVGATDRITASAAARQARAALVLDTVVMTASTAQPPRWQPADPAG